MGIGFSMQHACIGSPFIVAVVPVLERYPRSVANLKLHQLGRAVEFLQKDE